MYRIILFSVQTEVEIIKLKLQKCSSVGSTENMKKEHFRYEDYTHYDGIKAQSLPCSEQFWVQSLEGLEF